MSSWQNGEIGAVIEHYNDLEELNLRVLESMHISAKEKAFCKNALDIYYSLARMKKYAAANLGEKVKMELENIYNLCREYLNEELAKLINNCDMYVRLVFDVLLGARIEVPKDYFFTYKKLFEGGYVVYGKVLGKRL